MANAFDQLVDKFLNDELTIEEWNQFLVLVKEPAHSAALRSVLDNKLQSGAYKGFSEHIDMDLKFDQMLERAGKISDNEEEIKVIAVPRKAFSIGKRVAAAAVIIGIAMISYFLFFYKPTGPGESSAALSNDIKAPAVSKASITLSNGTHIVLDSVGSGAMAKQDNVTVTKTADGKIVYEGSAEKVVYNTLSNPRGSRVIDITLSDGSRVWLNAGSSITYPVAFIQGERTVSISGEAYFEIAHDASKPFIVSKGSAQVQVLGTHFNVNAYDDEEALKVTLLEGSVKASIANRESAILKPGQQAIIHVSRLPIADSRLTIADAVDLEVVMAWKNGIFHFGDKTDIGTIMREIARWYDVEVEYRGTITQHFWGSVPRNVSVWQVLKTLEATGGVKFNIDGKKITVMP